MTSIRSSVFLVLQSVFVFCSATISNPRNTAVVAGQRMEMRCRNDSQQSFRSWQTHRVSDEQEQTIFQYKGHATHFPQFGIDRASPGFVTLYSNSTLSTDAGVYRCTSFDSETSALVTYSAHLIVLESHPECQTDSRGQVIVKGSSITIRCSVRFKGNMVPQIEWRQSEIGTTTGGQSMAHGVSSSDNGHIISTLNIIVDFPQPRIFTFRTFFLATSTSSGDNYAAFNAPDYTYTWKSVPIGVPSPPSSSIAPSSQTVKSFPPDDDNGGESLKLSASTSSASATNGDSKIPFVFDQWMLISVCVGVAVFVSVIVAALFSYSRCLRKKRKAKAQPVNRISMPQFGNYAEMQSSADTYCSILGDDFAGESNTATGLTPQMLLAQRSLSAPGSSARTLPRPPPAQPVSNPSYYIQPTHHADKLSQRTNTLSHITRQNGQRGIGFTSPLSTSLPTIYQGEEASVPQIKNNARVPVQNGHREPEASSYLAAQDVLVEEDSEMSIPSMYLGVNKLSERNS